MFESALTVATFNIHHGVGLDGRLDLARTARVIGGIGADVVFVQELDRYWKRSGDIDQPKKLAALLGAQYRFGATVIRGSQEYGTAIFTRFPITQNRHHLLPNNPGLEPRGLLDVTVRFTAHTHLRLLGTHLQADSAGDATALRQAQTTLISEELDRHPLPTIVGGDFNDVRGATALDVLNSRLTETYTGAKIRRTQAWTRQHSDGTLVDIDHIYVSHHFQIDESWTIPTDASDHRPFVARLTLA